MRCLIRKYARIIVFIITFCSEGSYLIKQNRCSDNSLTLVLEEGPLLQHLVSLVAPFCVDQGQPDWVGSCFLPQSHLLMSVHFEKKNRLKRPALMKRVLFVPASSLLGHDCGVVGPSRLVLRRPSPGHVQALLVHSPKRHSISWFGSF